MAKQTVCNKTFIGKDGADHNHASADCVAVKFAFTNGESITVDPKDLPKAVRDAALLHGISQKVGDSYAGSAKAEGDPVVWAFEQAQTVIENMTNGVWITKREAGAPRVSMLLVAIERAASEAGKPFDADKMRAKLADPETGSDFRKACLGNAIIRAHYETLRREAQEAREQQAHEVAKDETLDGIL